MDFAMKDKVVVVTGATSGIGEVAADRLAQKGARIVFVARDRERGEATRKHFRAIAAQSDHTVHYADLTKLADQKRVAKEIADSEPQIDVLINNAGAMFATREVTDEGLEKTFALNHMSYFTITNILLDRLKATPGARIVSTASDAHRAGKLDLDDLQWATHRYIGLGVYGNSKLCNVLFTRELARRLAGTGVTANCLHPGFVGTRFGHNTTGLMAWAMKVAQNFALTPEQGAETIIYLASADDVEGKTGGYYEKKKLVSPSRAAQSDADAKRLWDISAKIAGVGF
jgi:NAD(P)-dependent dehydrogenase (short-subunit alcohol dehydrogenase family)